MIALQQISHAIRLQLLGDREKCRLPEMSNRTDRTAGRAEKTSNVRQTIFSGTEHLLAFFSEYIYDCNMPDSKTREWIILIAKMRLSRLAIGGHRTSDHSDEI